MTSSSSEVLTLLQKIDQASTEGPVVDQGADYWPAQFARADEAMDDVKPISDSPFSRDVPQDSETLVGFTNATGVSLHFSQWGNLVCIRRMQPAGETAEGNEADIALLAQSPEILTRHGFVPVKYEDLQHPYTGTLYGDEYHTANDHDWYWRFFDWH